MNNELQPSSNKIAVDWFKTMKHIKRRRWLPGTGLIILVLLLTACSSNTAGTTGTPTAMPVNGFGTIQNHGHSLIALPNNVLLLATHYGSYRSADAGKTWTQVTGGNNQLAQGLMNYSLVASSLNQQRLYFLTQPAINPHAGTLGLYTSADQGQTWKLAITNTDLKANNIYFVAAGNNTPDEVYVYLTDLGSHGLEVSRDNGQHFSGTGTLPFGRILGMLAIAGAPGQLLAYGNDGMALSHDSGKDWQTIAGITGGIFSLTQAGKGGPIYAGGDNGIYVSKDSGKTFKSVNTQANYAFLHASATQPQELYGKTGTAVYRSTDGGVTWHTLPRIKGNLQDLAPDPTNPSVLYLSLSYPMEVYRFDATNSAWSSLTPKA